MSDDEYVPADIEPLVNLQDSLDILNDPLTLPTAKRPPPHQPVLHQLFADMEPLKHTDDWSHTCAKLAVQRLFPDLWRARKTSHHTEYASLMGIVENMLLESEGRLVPVPFRPGETLPAMVRSTTASSSLRKPSDPLDAKEFYYVLWHVGDPIKIGGDYMPVQCLNGPYAGEYFARLDEAVRYNNLWAWSVATPHRRPSSLSLGHSFAKEITVMTLEGKWVSLSRFRAHSGRRGRATAKERADSQRTLRNPSTGKGEEMSWAYDGDYCVGLLLRPDLFLFPHSLPPPDPAAPPDVQQYVRATFSQNHRSCIATDAEGQAVDCCCPAPCYHPTLDGLSSKHVATMLRNKDHTFAPHFRALRGEPMWCANKSQLPNLHRHDALGYDISYMLRTYTTPNRASRAAKRRKTQAVRKEPVQLPDDL